MKTSLTEKPNTQTNQEKNQEPNIINKSNIKEKLEYSLSFIEIHKKTLSWLCPIIITVFATFLRFIWFVVESGKLLFWNIDSSAISMSENSMYNIVLLLFFSVTLLAGMLTPTIILLTNQKKVAKAFQFILIYITFFVVLVILTNIWDSIGDSWISILCFAIIVVAPIYLALILPGILMYWLFKPTKKTQNKKEGSIKTFCFSILMWIVVLILGSYYIGYRHASEINKFRITEDGYAIIYENDEYYYLAQYDPVKNQVNKDSQKVVKKDGVEYSWKK